MMSQAAGAATYLVVGASGAIGSAVARRLARPGIVIGLHYCQNRAAVESLQATLEGAGARGVCLQSPLDSDEACTRLSDRVSAELGTPDGIALCGGRVPWKPWRDVVARDWQDALFEHCVAPFTLARSAVLQMHARGEGRVVYLSSIAAKYGGSPRTLHYAAAKAALETAMHGLSRDVAGAGVRINGVRAGFVQSPQQRAGRSPQEIAERIQKIPMGRAGKPEEIAATIAFLISPESGFVTGEVVTVAGGD
jgi:NAD(P)-dependent dehydrogenase (short-subunit alcohol dehydrogenase family)